MKLRKNLNFVRIVYAVPILVELVTTQFIAPCRSKCRTFSPKYRRSERERENRETIVTARSSTINTHAVHIKHDVKVLLSTALVLIEDYSGAYHEVRVLLDSGSQSNFISSELSKKLQLPLRKIRLPVRGINQSSTEITAGTQAKIKATRNNYEIDVFCLIVPQITDNLPNFTFDTTLVNIPANLTLADPSFHVPSKVDMLLGAGIFWDLMCIGQIRTGPINPFYKNQNWGGFCREV